jgi:hypothetical protein
MKCLTIIFSLSIFLLSCGGRNNVKTIEVAAGDRDLVNAPVFADIDLDYFGGNFQVCLKIGNEIIPGQIENLTGNKKRVWWLANVKKGESARYQLSLSDECAADQFTWSKLSETSALLSYGEKPVIQYEHPVFDPENIEETKKPFHHVFDPRDGELITKGLGGLYPHHRGIFFGYNQVTVNDNPKSIDIWHARDGERSEHHEMISEYNGPVMGGHTVRISWKDAEGDQFIDEWRGIRIYLQGEDEWLIDFWTVLYTGDSIVRLDGDLHHAGVQFRAAQQVADDPQNTSFIRPAAWAHYDEKTELRDESTLGLPWNAMHFYIDGKPYTVAYFSHPSNIGRAEFSERTYGRFGEFVPAIVTEENRLRLLYRLWIKTGEKPTRETLENIYSLYADEPEVSILN